MQKGSETDKWQSGEKLHSEVYDTSRASYVLHRSESERRGGLEDCLVLRSERHLRFLRLTLSLPLASAAAGRLCRSLPR